MKNKTYLKILSVVSAAAVVVSGTTILGRAAGDVASEIEAYETQAEEDLTVMPAPAVEDAAGAASGDVSVAEAGDVSVAEAGDAAGDASVAEAGDAAGDASAVEAHDVTAEPAAETELPAPETAGEQTPSGAETETVTDEVSDETEAADEKEGFGQETEADGGDKADPAASLQDSEAAATAQDSGAASEEAAQMDGANAEITENVSDDQAGQTAEEDETVAAPVDLGTDMLGGSGEKAGADEAETEADPEAEMTLSAPALLATGAERAVVIVEEVDAVPDDMALAADGVTKEEAAETLVEADTVTDNGMPVNEAGPGSVELVGHTDGGKTAKSGGSSSSGASSASQPSQNSSAGVQPAPIPAAIAPEESTKASDKASAVRSPKTGDVSEPGIYAVLGLAALSAGAAVLSRKDETLG